MLNELKNRKLLVAILCGILSLLACVSLLFFYSSYKKETFQRAYRNQSIYEQLNSLMNTTQYAKEIKNAGYDVDTVGLKLNNRIDSLQSKGNPSVTISVPSKNGFELSIDLKGEDVVQLQFNKEMELTSCVYYKDGNYLYNEEIEEKLRTKYTKIGIDAVKSVLKDIYSQIS